MCKIIDIHSHSIKENTVVNSKAKNINNQYFYSIGIHPMEIDFNVSHQIEEINNLLPNKNIIAIGEIGLDNTLSTPLKRQIEIFEIQLNIAQRYSLPIIIHCVGFYNEIIQLKKENHTDLPWIIHGFRKKVELAKEFLKNDFYLSFGQYYNEKTIQFIPSEKILIETDDATCSIDDVLDKVAHSRQIDKNRMKTILLENTRNIFFNHKEL